MGVGFIITLILLSALLGMFARQALDQVDEPGTTSSGADPAGSPAADGDDWGVAHVPDRRTADDSPTSARTGSSATGEGALGELLPPDPAYGADHPPHSHAV